jgi:hypothetical protein
MLVRLSKQYLDMPKYGQAQRGNEETGTPFLEGSPATLETGNWSIGNTVRHNEENGETGTPFLLGKGVGG